MRRNIEIKLRVAELKGIRARALAAGARDEAVLVQTDTFFRVSQGRLKLREINGTTAELIAYSRDDVAGVKASDYHLAEVADAEAMHAALSAACGVTAVVRKHRSLLLWRNVRIHLDRVEGLGTFVELESVVGSVDEAQARRNLEVLLASLDLAEAAPVDVAYVDLLNAPDPRVANRAVR